MQIENYEEDGLELAENSSTKIIKHGFDLMKIKSIKFSSIPKLPFYSVKNYTKAETGDEAYFCANNELNFYAYKFHQINGYYPSAYRFEHFDSYSFINNLFEYYDIPLEAYAKVLFQKTEGLRLTSLLVGFKSDLLLYFDGADTGCLFYNENYEKDKDTEFYTLLGLLRNAKKPKIQKNKIYIVYNKTTGFDKIGFDVKKINVDLDENYNNGFKEISKEIVEGLNSKKKTNLVILSGDAGTGKTTYIRYLTSKLKKNIIFISPDMVDSITDPNFIPFLMDNNDSILIIEDAEPALEKRKQGGRSSAVSNVLNLTDGLLSDCLNISIVATFNTNTKNLDDALLRKGRLLMNYKFENLSVEKSEKLLKKLGHDVDVRHPMTLADIYFYGTDNNTRDLLPRQIGLKNYETEK